MSHPPTKRPFYLKKRFIIPVVLMGILLAWFLTINSLQGVDPKAIEQYKALKTAVKQKGLQAQFIVISGKRSGWFNDLLATYGNAVKQSRHLQGQAIDILVLDVNGDWTVDEKDVDLVYGILDQAIVKDKGGVGSYKQQSGFFTRQMVHFDARGRRARWQR